MPSKVERGRLGERIAQTYLTQKDYRILCSNYHCSYGEIDLIAQDGEYVVFVEVKLRKSIAMGSPGEAVNARKRERIRNSAIYYAQANGLMDGQQCLRFDVIEVVGSTEFVVNHIENAFE